MATKDNESMLKNIAFVSVSVHLWRGQFKINDAAVNLSGNELDKELVTRPRWNLMPTEWHDKFVKIEYDIHQAIAKACIVAPGEEFDSSAKLPIRGIHIIARKNLVNFFKDIKEIEQDKFIPLVDDLVANWTAITDDLKDKVKDQPEHVWASIAYHLPSASQLKSKFWLEKLLVPIQLNANDSLAMLEGGAAEEYAEEIKACGERFTKQVTDVIVDGLQAELGNAVDNLVNRIDSGGVIKEGTITMVRNAFNKLQTFDFVMTDELKAKLVDVGSVLDANSAKQLNKDLKTSGTDSVTAKLAGHLKDVRAQCSADMAAIKLHGRVLKRIKV